MYVRMYVCRGVRENGVVEKEGEEVEKGVTVVGELLNQLRMHIASKTTTTRLHFEKSRPT